MVVLFDNEKWVAGREEEEEGERERQGEREGEILDFGASPPFRN